MDFLARGSVGVVCVGGGGGTDGEQCFQGVPSFGAAVGLGRPISTLTFSVYCRKGHVACRIIP